MIRAMIIDDEPLAHEVILTYAKELAWLSIEQQCFSATQALAALQQQPVDLLFLDIQMPLLTGLELLKILPNKPHVILTTAYQEFALASYELAVTDYLLKPFRYDRFLQAVTKVSARLSAPSIVLQQQAQLASNNPPLADTIFIKVDKKQVQINLQEVCLFEAYGNYVKVWRDQLCQLTPCTLTSFEQSLPSEQFVRVHKSALVNRQQIDFIEGECVTLRSGKQVAIGKQYKKNLAR